MKDSQDAESVMEAKLEGKKFTAILKLVLSNLYKDCYLPWKVWGGGGGRGG